MSALATATVVTLYGEAAIHMDSSFTAHPCLAVIRRGQEVIGEYGQTIGVMDTITLSNHETTARSGESLTIADGDYAGEWVLHRKLAQTAEMTTFEAVKQV